MSQPFSLKLHEGEIVGLYDNGRGICSEIIHRIFEKRDWKSGSVILKGEELHPSIREEELIRRGMILIPDAMEHRLYLSNLSPQENLIFPILKTTSIMHLFNNRRVANYAWNSFQQIIDTYFKQDPIRGKYLEKCMIYYRCSLLVCVNPYRCADALTRKIVATFLRIAASQGISTLMTSCEYKEMYLVCDQIIEIK
jgi:ABC-type sugar transport system ATPase subunit